MNSRLILWLVLSVMAGCRCGERVDRAPELPVRVVPEALELGDVYVGRTRSLPLTLSNLDRSTTSVRATGLAAPFTVDPSEVELAGSESLELLVNFAPTSPGVFDASLTFTDAAGRALAVSLRGTGMAVPACDAPPVCAATVFDFDSGTCRTEALADGTACTASFACFAEAECQSGTCVGTLTTCDDRNACTLDACGETGCVHLDGALSCSVTDPCQATSCDPQLGCVSRPVEDGVPCGDATCETAAVCMSGTCQVRVRPNALQDCRYTQVVADFDSACAVTEGRGVRCWGRNQPFDWLRRGFESWVAGPGFMQGIVDARSIASSDNLSWVALSSGETAGTVRSNVPLNAVSVAAACPNGSCQICGLYQGSVSCVDSPGPNDAGARVVVSGGVTSLTMSNGFPPELCVVRAGEVSCGSESQLTPVPLPQLASMASSVFRRTACARLDDGSAWCWGAFGLADGGARVIWDAGVTALATNHDRFYSGAVCVATARGIECLPSNPFTQPDIRPVTTTPELGTITQLSVAQTVGCALLAGGQVACWGDNQVGQLGDRSAQPVGTRELPVRARWMHGFSSRVVFGFADGGAFTFGGTSADGGQSVLVDAGTKWLVPSLQAIEGSEVDYQGVCRRTAGEVFCGEFGPLPMPDATVFTTVFTGWQPQGAGVCVAGATGAIRCWLRAMPGGLTEFGLGPAGAGAFDAGAPVKSLANYWPAAGTCAVRSDGRVTCNESIPVTQTLTSVAQLCFGSTSGSACVRHESGALECWGTWVGSNTPTTPLGAWPVTRQLTCGGQHFCALSGSNIVQCWGNNWGGQLGREGPSSAQARSVPMPEPVVELAAGPNHTCALLQSGRVLCWGMNDDGQLGVPVLLSSPRPLIVTQ